MYIIWNPNDHQQFWLYMGQATNLQRRISDHDDKLYRRKHPSLHYHVWDNRDQMGSQFVVLAKACLQSESSLVSRLDQCLLNMQEMWMACFFQTLTGRDLDKYLSPAIRRQSAGRHLNIAPPIWQRFQDEEVPNVGEIYDRPKFQEHLYSEDPCIREWAQKVRDSYNDLRNSPDPELRQYWLDNNKRQLQAAWDVNEQNARQNLKIYQITGKEEVIQCSPDRDRGYITCGKFSISIPQRLNIPPGNKIHVQFHLYETSISHRYAREAWPDDPSSRLAISVRGLDIYGHEIYSWLQSRGRELPKRMNNLVDALEGMTYNETRLLRRRWVIIRSGGNSQRGTYYTE